MNYAQELTITNYSRTGRSIWESRCYVTNVVIQNGAHGYGKLRYRFPFETYRHLGAPRCHTSRLRPHTSVFTLGRILSRTSTLVNETRVRPSTPRDPAAHYSHPSISPDVDRCLSIYRLQRAVKVAVAASPLGSSLVIDIIKSADPLFFDWVVPETNHPVFQYIELTKSGHEEHQRRFADVIRKAAAIYPGRPLMGLSHKRYGVTGDANMVYDDRAEWSDDGSDWSWVTYRDAISRADNLQRGVKRLLSNFRDCQNVDTGNAIADHFFGIMAENR